MNEKCTVSKLANQNKRFCKLENYTVEFPFPNFLRTFHAIILRIVAKKLECASKLYIPSTLDLIFWQPHWVVATVKYYIMVRMDYFFHFSSF